MRIPCAALLAIGLLALGSGCKKRSTSSPPATGEPAALGAGTAPAPAVGSKLGTFTIGKDTTYILGPVDVTGHIDYPAAIHERLSQGVTAENNANVALWAVIGPTAPDGSKPSDAYFRRLGTPPASAPGEYFVGIKPFFSRTGQNTESVNKRGSRPWTARDDSTVAAWLQANTKPLAAVRETVKRTRYYNPIIPERGERGSKGLFGAPLPGTQAHRELAAALAARAMLYLGQNDHAEAWQDLLACHRLARLVGRGGTLIEGLVGMAIEQIACRAEAAFLAHAPPDPKVIERCLRDLFALPPRAAVAEHLIFDRFALLDVIMQIDQQGLDFLTALAGDAKEPHPLAGVLLAGTDWDPALRTANAWFDRLTACAQTKDRATRTAELAAFTRDLRALAERAKDTPRVSKEILESKEPAKVRGQAVGDILLSLMLPAVDKVIAAEERTRQTFDTVFVAFALGWHQRLVGRYPDSLAKLAPDYLLEVPRDVFSGKELIYRPQPNGFLLYSVGPNGADEGARTRESQPPGDDIVVRVPLPAAP